MENFEVIQNWISHLSRKQDSLNGLSVCPFSKTAKFEIVRGVDSIVLTDDIDLVIHIMPDDITVEELFDICKQLNAENINLVFLPDHRDRQTFIKDVRTSNNQINLILCQSREKLSSARQILKKIGYYDLWNDDYLEEILSL